MTWRTDTEDIASAGVSEYTVQCTLHYDAAVVPCKSQRPMKMISTGPASVQAAADSSETIACGGVPQQGSSLVARTMASNSRALIPVNHQSGTGQVGM